MMQFIKLEFRKIKIRNYFIASLIIALSSIGFAAFICFVSKVEGEALPFTTASGLFTFTSVLLNVSFVIVSSVLLSEIIIKEYEKHTIKVLFTYPISRKKIMLSKLVVVMIFSFLLSVLAMIVSTIGVTIMSYFIPILPNPITLQDAVLHIVSVGIVGVLTAVGQGLLPLYFGMRKKSIAATITAGAIIGILLNSNINGSSLAAFIIIPILACAIGLLVAYISYARIDKIDIL